ncbi:hypothetical protein D3C80_1072160 [compost metagenome]
MDTISETKGTSFTDIITRSICIHPYSEAFCKTVLHVFAKAQLIIESREPCI